MSEYDLIIRGGTVVTAADTVKADVGIRSGRIAAVAEKVEGGKKFIFRNLRSAAQRWPMTLKAARGRRLPAETRP
jgi:urease alpha subunit